MHGGGKELGSVKDGWSFAVVHQCSLVYIPNVSEREDVYRAAETLNSLTGLWTFSSSLF